MPKAVTKEKKKECIRLRVDENLSTPNIARSVGICNQSVYRILKNYPWRKERKAPTRGKLWTHEDDATVLRMWPVAEHAEILAALPGRSWYAIGRRACHLDIKRRHPSSRRRMHSVHPILEQLRRLREQRKITRPQLAQKTGYHINQFLGWENGKTRPLFRHVEDWASALGFSLILRPSNEQTVIAFPDRKKLMAGRE